MSTFWSIVKRETDERRLLILGALALGFLPFAAALIPSQIGANIGEARLELAIILAGVATGVTAFFLGASVIARDLAERRLSFYFSRPVPDWVIWGGKMTAAVGLSLATGFLIVLPALITGVRPVDGLPPAWLIQAAVVALLAIVGVAHVLSVLLRARSPWLLLDLGAALLVTLIVLAARAPLVRVGIPETPVGPTSVLVQGYVALAAVGILAALAAGAVQVAIGRTDPRRSHKALSLTLWGLLLPAALLFLGFSRWVTHVEPRDLETIDRSAHAAPAGPWVLLSGPARHRPGYFPSFLLDTSTAHAVRIDALPSPDRSQGRRPFLFSDDGRHAAWLDPQSSPPFRLMTLDLGRPASRPLATPVFLQGLPTSMALSRGGGRFATIERQRLLVHGLPKGELLASVALPDPSGSFLDLAFEDLDRVRLFYTTFDTKKREAAEKLFVLQVSSRSLTHQDLGRRPFEHWFDSLQPIGRFKLRLERGKDQLTLVIGSQDGAAERRVPLPGLKLYAPEGPKFYASGGQPLADHLVVSVTGRRRKQGDGDLKVILVDLEKGTLRPLARGLWPIASSWRAEIGAPATRLFLNEKELVRIDPETGRRTVVLRLS